MLITKNIELLVVHCSDTPNYENIGAADIHKMHIGFGWDGIGYHKVINRSGIIENGRPEYWIGAHVKGKNKVSLGVCMIGRDKFTDLQFYSLRSVLNIWLIQYPKAIVQGHSSSVVTDKTCPNFDVSNWFNEIEN